MPLRVINPVSEVSAKQYADSAEDVMKKYWSYPPPTKGQYDALSVMEYEEPTRQTI